MRLDEAIAMLDVCLCTVGARLILFVSKKDLVAMMVHACLLQSQQRHANAAVIWVQKVDSS